MRERSQSHIITRRTALTGVAGVAATGLLAVPAPARAVDGPAVAYMKSRVAKDLFTAAQQKTPESFLEAINRHADLAAISTYSVGDYSNGLTSMIMARLRRGVAGFMARYFASQAASYPVVRAEINGETPQGEGEVVVATRIYLSSGSSYSVEWLLAEHAKRYKIRDVRVMGFWLSPFQRDLFVRYIEKNNGDVNALLAALRV